METRCSKKKGSFFRRTKNRAERASLPGGTERTEQQGEEELSVRNAKVGAQNSKRRFGPPNAKENPQAARRLCKAPLPLEGNGGHRRTLAEPYFIAQDIH